MRNAISIFLVFSLSHEPDVCGEGGGQGGMSKVFHFNKYVNTSFYLIGYQCYSDRCGMVFRNHTFCLVKPYVSPPQTYGMTGQKDTWGRIVRKIRSGKTGRG